MPPDLIKRFSRTPFSATPTLNNMAVHVETNHPLVLSRLQFDSHSSEKIPKMPFARWRIVVEDAVNLPIANPSGYGVSHDGLTFICVAHSSACGAFLAADRRASFGISFVATEFVEQEHLFNRHYYPALLLMLREMGDTV